MHYMPGTVSTAEDELFRNLFLGKLLFSEGILYHFALFGSGMDNRKHPYEDLPVLHICLPYQLTSTCLVTSCCKEPEECRVMCVCVCLKKKTSYKVTLFQGWDRDSNNATLDSAATNLRYSFASIEWEVVGSSCSCWKGTGLVGPPSRFVPFAYWMEFAFCSLGFVLRHLLLCSGHQLSKLWT